MSRRLIIIMLTLSLLLGIMAVPALAAPVVILDGKVLDFDVDPVIENGRTLVPLRAIFEALGAEVDWDGNTQTVVANRPGVRIVLTVGNMKAYRNTGTVNLDVSARIVSGRTMVPLRFISESLGANVEWEENTQTIKITSRQATVFPIKIKDKIVGYYTGENDEGVPEGKGTLVFINGDIYEGEFENGKMEGRGTLLFAGGSRYTGEFADNLANGYGVLEYSSGSVYRGDFKDGKRDGYGVLTYPDGSKQDGEWVENYFFD